MDYRWKLNGQESQFPNGVATIFKKMRHFCTLFDCNYLIRGLALYKSLKRNCATFHLWILCMDQKVYDTLQLMNLDFVSLIRLADFEDKKLLMAKKNRTFEEYCWTCTPSLPLYVLKNNPKLDTISYLDADLYFFSSPEPIFKEAQNASIVIIPHRFPKKEKCIKREKETGKYNVGMLIFKNDKNGKKCLDWWREQCLDWCYNRVEPNRMGDQKYLEEFSQRFLGVHILQHLGAGVANWNVENYSFKKNESGIFVDEFPLIFYHFQRFEIYKCGPYLFWGPRKLYRQVHINREIMYKPYATELAEELEMMQEKDPSYQYKCKPCQILESIFDDINYWRKKESLS